MEIYVSGDGVGVEVRIKLDWKKLRGFLRAIAAVATLIIGLQLFQYFGF